MGAPVPGQYFSSSLSYAIKRLNETKQFRHNSLLPLSICNGQPRAPNGNLVILGRAAVNLFSACISGTDTSTYLLPPIQNTQFSRLLLCINQHIEHCAYRRGDAQICRFARLLQLEFKCNSCSIIKT